MKRSKKGRGRRDVRAEVLAMTKCMTVSELIERLQRCHPEASVRVVTKLTPKRFPFCWVDGVVDVFDDGASVGIWPIEAERVAAQDWAEYRARKGAKERGQ